MAESRDSLSLFQTYNDIVYAQQWKDVEVIDLPPCSRRAVKGKRGDSGEVLHVIPCAISEELSFGWLQDAFKFLFPDQDANQRFVYLAITSSDSSIVYYKVGDGMVKPSL